MIIVVTCREVKTFERKIGVYALDFNPQSKVFSMSYCDGDMWGIELKCPLEVHPINISFFRDAATVRFDRQDEAEAFVAWLIEGEKRVQRGFRTMRG